VFFRKEEVKKEEEENPRGSGQGGATRPPH